MFKITLIEKLILKIRNIFRKPNSNKGYIKGLIIEVGKDIHQDGVITAPSDTFISIKAGKNYILGPSGKILFYYYKNKKIAHSLFLIIIFIISIFIFKFILFR